MGMAGCYALADAAVTAGAIVEHPGPRHGAASGPGGQARVRRTCARAPARRARRGPRRRDRCRPRPPAGPPRGRGRGRRRVTVVTARRPRRRAASGAKRQAPPRTGRRGRTPPGRGPGRPARAKAYGTVRQASRAMCHSRSVGAGSGPEATATSPAWIQVSASRVVASVRAESSPATQVTRAPRSAAAKPRPQRGGTRVPARLHVGRRRAALDARPWRPPRRRRRRSAASRAASRLEELRPSCRRGWRRAISFVWARCSTTSDTLHPAAAGGGRPAGARPARRGGRRGPACSSARAETAGSIAAVIVGL